MANYSSSNVSNDYPHNFDDVVDFPEPSRNENYECDEDSDSTSSTILFENTPNNTPDKEPQGSNGFSFLNYFSPKYDNPDDVFGDDETVNKFYENNDQEQYEVGFANMVSYDDQDYLTQDIINVARDNPIDSMSARDIYSRIRESNPTRYRRVYNRSIASKISYRLSQLTNGFVDFVKYRIYNPDTDLYGPYQYSYMNKQVKAYYEDESKDEEEETIDPEIEMFGEEINAYETNDYWKKIAVRFFFFFIFVMMFLLPIIDLYPRFNLSFDNLFSLGTTSEGIIEYIPSDTGEFGFRSELFKTDL